MPRTLVLVRHGIPENFNPEGDAARRLTPEGLRVLKRAYPEGLASLRQREGLRIWSSPAVRALQTAEAVADALGIDPGDVDLHQSLYEQDEEEFLLELGAEDPDCVVVVGHVPFMEHLAYRITGVDLLFCKGLACAIELGEDNRGRVLWCVRP